MKEFFLKIKGYLSEVGGEARRVTWPTSRECYDSTLVVIAFIFILAVTTLALGTRENSQFTGHFQNPFRSSAS